MEDKNEFYALVLVSAGKDKETVLSQIIQLINCEIEFAKTLVDKQNSRLITTLTHSAKDLIDIKLKLEQLGATTKIVKCIKKSSKEISDKNNSELVSDEQTKCPFCGGIILKKAKKCKHCGKWIDENIQSKESNKPKIEYTQQPQTTIEKCCPFCCKNIPLEAKKCQYCGEWLETKPKSENIVYKCWRIFLGILILIISIILECLSNGTGFGITFALVACIACAIYFIPTSIADEKRHKYTIAIFWVNLFFGFTIIGWVGALAWSLVDTENN